MMREFQGIAISSGKVIGPACLFSAERHKAVEQYELETDEEVSRELERFEEAIDTCSSEVDVIVKNVTDQIGKPEAEIFLTQKHIMNDPAIVEKIRHEIMHNKKNVEAALSGIFSAYEEKFSRIDDEYLKERATDIGEIRRRLLDHLRNVKRGFKCEGQKQCGREKNSVLVAEEMSADMATHLNFKNVKGVVTETGGVTSHAAIIARSLGIPAVSGIRGVMGHVECGTPVLIDGDTGKIYIHPDKKLTESIPVAGREEIETTSDSATPEGMELLANACMVEDAKTSCMVNADGIGLFRTEILFLAAGRLLSEDEQHEKYSAVVRRMGAKPVTFRLLDVGGDKVLPFLKSDRESRPSLGWSGAKFLLGNPDISGDQIRAIARVSKIGRVNILFPMVIDTEQLGELCKMTRENINRVEITPGHIKLGAMFEVPSACLDPKGIFELIDFASIGSNDLIQYLFAADRANPLVSHDHNPNHPVLWKLLKKISHAAEESGKPLSICGEMAGIEGMASRLIEIGITSLSVTPRLIPRVRNEMVRCADTGKFTT